jgi:hypothetical protein
VYALTLEKYDIADANQGLNLASPIESAMSILQDMEKNAAVRSAVRINYHLINYHIARLFFCSCAFLSGRH